MPWAIVPVQVGYGAPVQGYRTPWDENHPKRDARRADGITPARTVAGRPAGQFEGSGKVPVASPAPVPAAAVPSACAASRTAAATVLATSGWNTLGTM